MSRNSGYLQKLASDMMGVMIDVREADQRIFESKRRRQIYAGCYLAGYVLMNYGDRLAIKLAPITPASVKPDNDVENPPVDIGNVLNLDALAARFEDAPPASDVVAYTTCAVCDHERWQHTSKSAPQGFVHPCRVCDCPDFVKFEADVAEPADDGA
jgi:hypothetical protein